MDLVTQVGLRALERINGKDYLHFDFPVTESERKQLVSDIASGNIVHHRYLPFISFEIRFRIYHARQKSVQAKARRIMLPSHHDALMYRFYGQALNRLYSNYALSHHINDVAVAYRERHPGVHLSNITTAKEVFDRITALSKSWVIKGDFHHFFDTLSHRYLGTNLQKVFSGNLPKDWKKMFRAITQCQSISRKTLEKQLQTAHIKVAYRTHHSDQSNARAYVKNLQELGKLIQDKKIRLSGKNRVGIPQGTAVSAVLANVYMIDFDEWLAKLCKKEGGLYRRYSDDFIIVLPQKQFSEESVKTFAMGVIQRSKTELGLKIESTKTKLYSYDQDNHSVMLYPIQETGKQGSGRIDYLGFVFDGISVSMRSKSIYKFIYRGRRKVGKYVTLGRLYDQVKNGFSDSDIIQNQMAFKYNTRSKKSKKRPVVPNIYQTVQTLHRLQQIREMKYETLRAIHKGVTIRYLSAEVKNPRASMLAYASRAQQIFEVGQPKYRVVILRQVLRQIKHNQKKLHQGRHNYKHWRYSKYQF
ncbi:MAG: reverse transcriptase [Lacticaseibacillus rhamnosus]|nr:reverse transcriptase [Lacticaseibacillus rhamnosus]OFN12855.1 reverse transcriptase [Lactobacillus sp. HMSC072E07]